MTMDYESALRQLMSDPEYRQLMVDSYIAAEPLEAARRFATSAEWAAVMRLLGTRLQGATVLDVGAGNGIASWAFVQAGASIVYALEPHPGELAGRGAVEKLHETRILPLEASGEAIPLEDEVIDIVYARQVLHHVTGLGKVLAECARVLRPGGIALFTREHVADTPQQLDAFLESHPVHRLAGGEHAYPFPEYLRGIVGAGLRVTRIWGPRDTVINAFPDARSDQDLPRLIRREVGVSLRWLRVLAERLPGIEGYGRWRARRKTPGRLFSFMVVKESSSKRSF